MLTDLQENALITRYFDYSTLAPICRCAELSLRRFVVAPNRHTLNCRALIWQRRFVVEPSLTPSGMEHFKRTKPSSLPRTKSTSPGTRRCTRQQFCAGKICVEQPEFLWVILFTNEAGFTLVAKISGS
jgi:hypothetical protein